MFRPQHPDRSPAHLQRGGSRPALHRGPDLEFAFSCRRLLFQKLLHRDSGCFAGGVRFPRSRRDNHPVGRRRANHPTGPLLLSMSKDLVIVRAPISQVDEPDSRPRFSRVVDHPSPDLRFALPLLSPRGRFIPSRPRLPVKQFLRRNSHQFFRFGGDHHRGVQQKAQSFPVPRRPQPRYRMAMGERELGRIVNQQPRPGLARPGQPAVWFDNLCEGHVVLIQQTIGRLAVRPAVGLIGRAGIRVRRHLRAEPDQTPGAPNVSQFTRSKLLLRPFHRIQHQTVHGNASMPRRARDGVPQSLKLHPPFRGGRTRLKQPPHQT